MNRKKMAMTIITAMMVTLGFAATTTAINVDGVCTDWSAESLVKTDPVCDYPGCPDDGTIGGYDLTALYLYYYEDGDTLFVRLDVDGKPADLDGDGNTGIDCNIAPGPGDCPGVGCYEHYSLGFSSSPGTVIVYTCNEARNADGDSHPDGNAQYGLNCIEFSLSHASDYINPDDYCIHVSAGGMQDAPMGEDNMEVCIMPSPTPTPPPPQLPPSVSVLTPAGIIGLIGILCIAGAGRVMRRR